MARLQGGTATLAPMRNRITLDSFMFRVLLTESGIELFELTKA